MAAFAVVIAMPDARFPMDVGRAMQNMMLVAWNEGVVSCPNGIRDAEAAASTLGFEEGLRPVNAPSFAYPKRPLDPELRSAEDWSAEADRKPLDDLVRRI
jgi:nitroreductase